MCIGDIINETYWFGNICQTPWHRIQRSWHKRKPNTSIMKTLQTAVVLKPSVDLCGPWGWSIDKPLIQIIAHITGDLNIKKNKYGIGQSPMEYEFSYLAVSSFSWYWLRWNVLLRIRSWHESVPRQHITTYYSKNAPICCEFETFF